MTRGRGERRGKRLVRRGRLASRGFGSTGPQLEPSLCGWDRAVPRLFPARPVIPAKVGPSPDTCNPGSACAGMTRGERERRGRTSHPPDQALAFQRLHSTGSQAGPPAGGDSAFVPARLSRRPSSQTVCGPLLRQSLAQRARSAVCRRRALIAQLVEHLICNQGVGGSSPSGGTSHSHPSASPPRLRASARRFALVFAACCTFLTDLIGNAAIEPAARSQPLGAKARPHVPFPRSLPLG